MQNQFKNQGTKLIPDEPKKQAEVLQRMYEVWFILISEIVVVSILKKSLYYRVLSIILYQT